MLVCIAGKNDIAVNVLEYLLDYRRQKEDLEVVCIVNKTETGVNGWQKSLKWYCNKNHVKIVSLEDVYQAKDLLFLSLEFDQILKPELFNTKKIYNIHFSMLPKYKGMYTSIWPVLNGEAETGVTLHLIDKGIDTGDVVEQQSIKICDDDNAYDIYKKYIEVGTSLVINSLEKLISLDIVCATKQKQELSTYYPKESIDFSKIVLDCKRTAWQIKKQVKAFAFRPYQLIKFNGCSIFDVMILGEKSVCKPGMIVEENRSWIKVSTIDYNILLYKDEYENLLECIAKHKNSEAKKILELKRYICEKNNNGWTPLMVAVYNNNKEMFYYLIDNGASITEKNWNGTNMLMYAKDCYKTYSDSELFEYLVDKGLDLNEKDFSDKDLMDYCKIDGINQIGKVKLF